MKRNFKKILLLFLFTGMLFVSCTTEEDVLRNENYKSKFQIREQSYQELIKVNTFKRALDKIPKQKTSTTLNGKTVMEEQYGFSIIDTPIKITETEETIAYNLLVKSDTITDGNYFENLLINIDKDTNLIKAYLVKYNLEDTNLVYTNHNSFLFSGTRSAREIVYNNNPIRVFGKEVFGPCISYQILMCSYQGNHVAGEQCILNNFDLLYVQTQTSGNCSNGLDPIDTSGGVGGTTSSGGTTSNGNTNDDSTTVVDNPTPPCTDCLELTAELDSFLGNLDVDQFAIWDGLDYVVKRSIVSYLVQNSYSSESMAFVKEALKALNEGGEVDFTLQIILAPSFKNNPRLKCVWDKINSGDNNINDYLRNFKPEFSVAHLRFKNDVNFSSNQPSNLWDAGAVTIPPNNYIIDIIVNSDPSLASSSQNFPTIIIALEIIHETIHAEMFRKLMECAGLPHVNFNNMTETQWVDFMITLMNNYPGLHDYFLRFEYNTSNPTDSHHEMMAQNYIDIMSEALKDFDNNSHNDEFYRALSWIGLKETVAWNRLSTAEKNNIDLIIQNAISNETFNCTN